MQVSQAQEYRTILLSTTTNCLPRSFKLGEYLGEYLTFQKVVKFLTFNLKGHS